MRKITGEFCPPRPPSRLAWAALVLLLVLSAFLWTGVAVQVLDARQAQDEAARLETLAAEARQRASSSITTPMPWDASARLMLEHAGSRWPQVLAVLESSRAMGVVPVTLSINVPAHTVTLELQAADYPLLLDYIAQLNAGDPSIRWRLVQASADAKSGAAAQSGMPQFVRATIAADLRGMP